jgi:putative nucleotidyltransferase with HDIG domain
MTSQNEAFVLAADSDPEICKLISDCLSSLHVKVAVASDSLQLFEMLFTLNPQIIIIDYQILKTSDFLLLESVRKEKLKTQIVVIADNADVKTAVDIIKRGAADFLPKPIDIIELENKIGTLLKVSRPVFGMFTPNEIPDLYNVLKKISTTENIDSLTSVVFDSMISITGADSGMFQVYNKEKHEMVTLREYGRFSEGKKQSRFSQEVKDLVADFSVSRKQSAILCYDDKGDASTFSDSIAEGNTFFEVSIPITLSGDTIGVVSLCKDPGTPGFTVSDLKVIEVIASQTGTSAYHAGLYLSINHKLEELMLISNFSEQLMGMVDKYDIIRTLCAATVKYLPIDIIGFLVVQKRAHEFLYWVRNSADVSRMDAICSEVVDAFNISYSATVDVKRVRLRSVKLSDIAVNENTECSIPEFKHILPVSWEDFKFGAFYFETCRKLENKAENTALLSNLVNQARIALTNSKLYSDIKENYIRTIKALAIAVDAKDTYTHGHSENVMNIAEEIAREMNLDEKTIGIIRDAGLLHDIGKIGIPGYILNKPGPLTYEEFNGIMKTHSALGANIVKDVPFLQGLYKLILHHHEHYDGSGYPDGIKGEQIPLGARILHVADAFEAMTSNRPYRNSLGEVEALRRLVEAKSIQFDPVIIDAFLRFAYRKYKIKL